MSENQTSITDRRLWVRVLYMVFFWVAFTIAEMLLGILALFQAVHTLLTGSTNDFIHHFGKNLSVYVKQVSEYLTFNTDELAFPFNDWPNEDPTPSEWNEKKEDVTPEPEAKTDIVSEAVEAPVETAEVKTDDAPDNSAPSPA